MQEIWPPPHEWPAPKYPTDADPEVADSIRSELERQGLGWKLHLNFDATDRTKVAAVSDTLARLQEDAKITTYKIGHGGGKASGAPGKEATVYVGPRDKAEYVARIIGSLLDPVLDLPEGDTLYDDRPFGETGTKVMGRFDIERHDPDFLQYGRGGVPLLKRDGDRWNLRERSVAMAAAEETLRVRYGPYYTGTTRNATVAPKWYQTMKRGLGNDDPSDGKPVAKADV
jgi:hypothetical protein